MPTHRSPSPTPGIPPCTGPGTAAQVRVYPPGETVAAQIAAPSGMLVCVIAQHLGLLVVVRDSGVGHRHLTPPIAGCHWAVGCLVPWVSTGSAWVPIGVCHPTNGGHS